MVFNMTKEDIEYLKRLDEAATRGPWVVSGESIIQTHHFTRDVWFIPRQPEDLPLIAAMRNFLPDLMALAEDGLKWRKATEERKPLSAEEK